MRTLVLLFLRTKVLTTNLELNWFVVRTLVLLQLRTEVLTTNLEMKLNHKRFDRDLLPFSLKSFDNQRSDSELRGSPVQNINPQTRIRTAFVRTLSAAADK